MIIDTAIEWIFRFWAYVFFGFVMEIKVTAISKVTDGTITQDDRKLHGNISLWMIPVYGLLILFFFEAVNSSIESLNIIIRYIVWSITFTFFEILSGWFYDRFLHIRPWDYRKDRGSICNGYTKIHYIPLWGLVGLVIEQYSSLMIYISPGVVEYFKNIM